MFKFISKHVTGYRKCINFRYHKFSQNKFSRLADQKLVNFAKSTFAIGHAFWVSPIFFVAMSRTTRDQEMITKVNFLLTIKPIRRTGEIGRYGVLTEQFLEHCFVKNMIFFFEVFVSKKRKFCGTNFLGLAFSIIFCLFWFYNLGPKSQK